MTEEQIKQETKAQEQAQRDTVSARVAQLVAMADAARSSGNALDLDAVRQALGAEAMIDAVVAMMEANVRGDLDNSVMQTALTTALAQQQLVDGQTARIVEELRAATPAKTEEAKVEAAPAEVKTEEVKAGAPAAEQPKEHLNQVEAMRAKLEAEKKDTKVDQVAEQRAKQAEATRGVA